MLRLQNSKTRKKIITQVKTEQTKIFIIKTLKVQTQGKQPYTSKLKIMKKKKVHFSYSTKLESQTLIHKP